MEKIDEKINHFSNIIFTKAAKEKDEILQNIEVKRKEILRKKELEYLEKAYENIQTGLRRLDKEKNEIISRSIMDGKKRILNKREAIINLIIENTKEKLSQFVRSDEYEDYLVRTIKRGLEEMQGQAGQIEILLCKEDEILINKLNEKFDVQFIISEKMNGMIGGCLIYNKGNNTLINNTIKDDLYAKKQSIMEMTKLISE